MEPRVHTVFAAEQEQVGWRWRDCRSLGIGARLWLWPWQFGFHVDEDQYGGERSLSLGPLDISISYSVGSHGKVRL